MGKNGKKLAIGTAIGLLAGYVTGILTAPKSGKETRGDIAKVSVKALREAEKQLKTLFGELDEAIVKAKQQAKNFSDSSKVKLDDLIEKAKDSKQKAKEVLSAIRAGDAEDPDLKSAIKEATDAKNHLLDFIKKSE